MNALFGGLPLAFHRRLTMPPARIFTSGSIRRLLLPDQLTTIAGPTEPSFTVVVLSWGPCDRLEAAVWWLTAWSAALLWWIRQEPHRGVHLLSACHRVRASKPLVVSDPLGAAVESSIILLSAALPPRYPA
jgi:hypothetical protein